MTDKIPREILARDDDSAESFKAQQDRIAKHVQDAITKDIEDQANGGK